MDGVCSEEREEINNIVEEKTSIQDNPKRNAFSDESLITKLMEGEDRFNVLDSRMNEMSNVVTKLAEGLGGLINHVNTISSQFNESATVMKQLSEIIKSGSLSNNVLNQQVQPSKGGNNAESIMAAMQQQQQTEQQMPQQTAQGLLGNIGGSGGVVNILDRILQFYLATKSAAPTIDPAQAFMSNLQSSVDLLKSMSGLVSNLKNDWIKEERLVHQIEKSNTSKAKAKKQEKEE